MNGTELKKHNKESFDSIKELFKTYNRVALEQATSTGKSYVAAKVIETLGFNRVLYLAPSNYIINQFKSNFHYLYESVSILDFITYTKTLYLKEYEILEDDYDLIILDEYHRLGANQWYEGVNCILNKCKNAKILGLTATAIRYLDGNRDMTDELFNGIIANKITLSDAIESNILSKPRYVIGLYDLERNISKLEGDLNKFSGKNKSDIEKNIRYLTNNFDKVNGAANILKKYITSERKFIVFCENSKHLEDIKGTVVEWFKLAFNEEVNEYFIYHKNKGNNFTNYELFKNSSKNEFNLLFVVDMLNEGVHIDGDNKVDGIIMLRSTFSPNIYYQQLGRAMTIKGEDKPLIFDFVNNTKIIINYNYLNKSFNNEGKFKDKYNKKSYEILSLFDIYDETKDIIDIITEVELSLCSWSAMFEEIKLYYEENGHFSIPKSLKKLYRWKNKQCSSYKDGTLPKDRYDKLSSIGFPFSELEERWNTMYNQLKEFKVKFGHTDVSKHTGEYKELGSWCYSMIRSYKNGSLSNKRINLLLKLGFNFNKVKDRELELWRNTIKELKEYKEDFGHLNPSSRSKDERDKKILSKVVHLRKYYKEGKLPQYKIDDLLDIGFEFDRAKSRVIQTWNKRYNEVKECYIKGISIRENGSTLSSWISKQKSLYDAGKLSDDQINLLKEVGIIF